MKTILLVEDDPADELLTLRAFGKHDMHDEIVVARDGQQALDMLFAADATAPFAPRLILLDLKLPKVDGLEVLRQIRANTRTRSLPVVILTTSRELADVTASYDLGCNSYVRKPVTFAAFLEATRQLGIYWLSLNETPQLA